ncbi:serine/threonine-protein kinase [Demequina capsici]|uniref:non-specific serine/threonine protein kinase n=1 Tax=Demequina capsici TaxID=3075620 RepID=A0AA96FF21_9MICO|nr:MULTISPECIES: serine/threonine-protein kinase [unclassified Demequina]WNM24534.1 serine/threonine-protein kinase [Demequina sp. OYTSA14]WNM27386.1 serine/threonine-protein kinase [Demequina sp. PMTSA13]
MRGIAGGTTLGGRYVLESLIAVGGMGEVWRASDIDLSRPVAVKTLKEASASNATFLKRFGNEARNAAGVQHPNIAQVLDYGDQEGTAYLVMELVDGEPMSTILERDRVIPEQRLVKLMIAACRGLQAAHDAGVMHRDIKPGNLLVFGDDDLKITDFGVSRSQDQTTLTATGMVMGTAQYLAPELALGKPATPASDLYSLGIIMYESVVGKRPFTAANAVDIAVAQVNEKVPPLPDHVSPELTALILKVLEKNPRRRPHDATELEHLLAGLALRAPSDRVLPDVTVDSQDDRSARRRMPPSVAPRVHRPRPDLTGPRG